MVTETTGFENIDTPTLRNLWRAGFGDDKVLCDALDALIRQKTELGMIGLEVCRRREAESTKPVRHSREYYYVLVDKDANR